MVQLKNRPALIIVDMQNGFAHESGTVGRLGIPTVQMRNIVPKIDRLRSICNKRGIPIIFTKIGFKEDYSDSGLLLADAKGSYVKEMRGWIQGTRDTDMLDGMLPDANEIVLEKTRNSAFWGTGFDKLLAEREVDHLIVAGIGTNICVESTVRDAFTNGNYVTTVSDAVAGPDEDTHKASLKTLGDWFGGTATVAEVEEALDAV
ncbi:hypothetical protein LTR37_010623 [Vermiconidia calcicola]|uniref:Uncharacterized protein n=1 Tax=Vermiconidia calcicola TaxID=1690605 RepID=A0ACC3N4M7_9PEZI|nr:hypothetical protein LTR37_010623 [Vermiconidia calcicola]